MEQQNTNSDPIVADEINLLDFLLVLVKRKRLIIGLTLAASVLSAGYSLTLPNIYTATAKILPPQKDAGGGLSAALGQLGGLAAAAGLGGGSFSGSTELYVSILKSRTVADAVIKRLNLIKEFKSKSPDDARKSFAGRVKFTANAKDGIITITANHKKPEMAATLVSTTLEELGRRSVELNLVKANNERTFLEKRLVIVKQDLIIAEEEMKSFSQQNKAIQIDAQSKASIEGVAKLKAELATREVQMASMRSYLTEESPEVKTLLAATARLKSELTRFSGIGGGVGEGIPTVGNLPNLGLEYLRRLREVKIQEAILEQLTKQYELAKLNESRDTSTLQILDEAVVPNKKSKPKRSLIVILATISAFFVSVVTAIAAEYGEKMGEEDRRRWQTIKGQLRIWR